MFTDFLGYTKITLINANGMPNVTTYDGLIIKKGTEVK